jgi:DNA polymerase-1
VESGNKRCVYLIDASIYIFRAWYSVPDTLLNSDGQPINALHGFAGFLAEFIDEVKPSHLAVVFDESLTTSFRNDIYPDYKANRETPPEDLMLQFQYCRDLVRSLGLADFSSQHYEADDLIGTLAARMREQDYAIVILSADKDLAQLIEASDMLWDYARKRRHYSRDIPAWLGVEAWQVADWLALTGDSVDNIPGVPGIGAKIAAALLAEFETLDKLYQQLDAVAAMKIRGAARVQRLLQEHRESAMLARLLTGIAVDPEMQVKDLDIVRSGVDASELQAACAQLGLGGMITSRLTRAVC